PVDLNRAPRSLLLRVPGLGTQTVDRLLAARRVRRLRLDDRLDVVKALARIAPIHREVLVLYYFDDMPTAQMAEALDIAPGTVLSRLSRARDALKAALEQAAPAPAPETASVIPLRP